MPLRADRCPQGPPFPRAVTKHGCPTQHSLKERALAPQEARRHRDARSRLYGPSRPTSRRHPQPQLHHSGLHGERGGGGRTTEHRPASAMRYPAPTERGRGPPGPAEEPHSRGAQHGTLRRMVEQIRTPVSQAHGTVRFTSPALPRPFTPSPAPPARPPSLFTEARLGVRQIELPLRRGRHLPGSLPCFRYRCACVESAEMAVPPRKVFVWEDGTPMRFYIRPGMAKLRLAPLLLAGGAGLCRVQEPGAVHLVQPGEPAPDGAVSTEYVMACVESQRRLPLDRYWHSGPAPPAASPRGRLPFTEAEDVALLRAVRERSGARVSGTALWKELECAGLTRHSWQAMRDRYLRHLRPLHRGELRAGAGPGGRARRRVPLRFDAVRASSRRAPADGGGRGTDGHFRGSESGV